MNRVLYVGKARTDRAEALKIKSSKGVLVNHRFNGCKHILGCDLGLTQFPSSSFCAFFLIIYPPRGVFCNLY